MIPAFLALTEPFAHAWEQAVDAGSGLPIAWGAVTQATYRINANDFTSGERAAIEDGADAWHGGGTTVIRGVDWQFVRGADTTSDGTHGNGVNNVRMRPDSEVESEANNGSDDALAVTHLDLTCWPGAGCGIDGFDISFSDTATWSDDVPNNDAGDERSIGQVAMHEFGHAAGLDHEAYGTTAIVATMNAAYPNGGDTSGLYRISEDDYVGMAVLHPGVSTGKNLMLSRFSNERTAAHQSEEVWTAANSSDVESTNTWCTNPGGYIYGPNTPSMLTILMTGTSGSVTANVKWRLHQSGSCDDGDEYTVDSRTFTIGVNEPFRPQYADWYLPSTIPTGDYQLCAIIDAADTVAETVEWADNDAYSEKTFQIRSTLTQCP